MSCHFPSKNYVPYHKKPKGRGSTTNRSNHPAVCSGATAVEWLREADGAEQDPNEGNI